MYLVVHTRQAISIDQDFDLIQNLANFKDPISEECHLGPGLK